MNKYATSVIFSSLILTGCASQQTHYKEQCLNPIYSLFCFDEVYPKETSSSDSRAYKLAKQTILVQNEENILRDFSKSEIENAKTRAEYFTANNPMVFGESKEIDANVREIAKGISEELYKITFESKGASSPVFVVELNAQDFASKEDAASYLVSTVEVAAKELLEEVGFVQSRTTSEGIIQKFVNVKGKDIPIGLRKSEKLNSGNSIEKVDLSITGEKGEFYSYTVLSNQVEGLLIEPPTPLALSASLGNINYEQFMKAYTKRLPNGFYIYTPPFPVYKLDGVTYVNFSEVAPAIYHSGEKYTFVTE